MTVETQSDVMEQDTQLGEFRQGSAEVAERSSLLPTLFRHVGIDSLSQARRRVLRPGFTLRTS